MATPHLLPRICFALRISSSHQHFRYTIYGWRMVKEVWNNQMYNIGTKGKPFETMKTTTRKISPLQVQAIRVFPTFFRIFFRARKKRRNYSSEYYSLLQMAEILFFCAELYYACKIYGKLYKISTYISTAVFPWTIFIYIIPSARCSLLCRHLSFSLALSLSLTPPRNRLLHIFCVQHLNHQRQY